MKDLLPAAGQQILVRIQLSRVHDAGLDVGDAAVILSRRNVVTSENIVHLHLHLPHLPGVVGKPYHILRQSQHLFCFRQNAQIIAEIRDLTADHGEVLVNDGIELLQITDLILIGPHLLMAFQEMVGYLRERSVAVSGGFFVVFSQHLMILSALSGALVLVDIFLVNPVDELIIHIPSHQDLLDQAALLELFQNPEKSQPVHAGHQQFQLRHADLAREDGHASQHLPLFLRDAGKPGLDDEFHLRRPLQRKSLFPDDLYHLIQEKGVAVAHLIEFPALLRLIVKVRQHPVKKFIGLLGRKGVKLHKLQPVIPHQGLQLLHHGAGGILTGGKQHKVFCGHALHQLHQQAEAQRIHPLNIVNNQKNPVLPGQVLKKRKECPLNQLIPEFSALLGAAPAAGGQQVGNLLFLLGDIRKEAFLRFLIELLQHIRPGGQEEFRTLTVAHRIDGHNLLSGSQPHGTVEKSTLARALIAFHDNTVHPVVPGTVHQSGNLKKLPVSSEEEILLRPSLCRHMLLHIKNTMKQIIYPAGGFHLHIPLQKLLQIVIQPDRHGIIAVFRIHVHGVIIQVFIVRVVLDQKCIVLLHLCHVMVIGRFLEQLLGRIGHMVHQVAAHRIRPLLKLIAVFNIEMREKCLRLLLSLIPDRIQIYGQVAFRVNGHALMSGGYQEFLSQRLPNLVNGIAQLLFSCRLVFLAPEKIDQLFSGH